MTNDDNDDTFCYNMSELETSDWNSMKASTHRPMIIGSVRFTTLRSGKKFVYIVDGYGNHIDTFKV